MLKIIIFRKLENLHNYCADQFIKQVQTKPHATIGFATGVSPLVTYQKIIADYKTNGTSWHDVTTFNLDEFIGIDPQHPEVFRNQMQNNLFCKINVQQSKIHLPDSQTRNPNVEAARYEALIKAKGPIDFQYVSLGINGHIAYNEPGTSLQSVTHVATLSIATIIDMVQKGKFSSIEAAPTQAITMGVQTILQHTKRVIMVAYGAHKADVTKLMLESTPNRLVTASSLQWHPDCTFVLDLAAASELTAATLKNAQYR